MKPDPEKTVVDAEAEAVRLAQELFLPLLVGELAVGVIAVLLVLAYRAAGIPVLFAAIPVFIIFRQLTVALVRSGSRAYGTSAPLRSTTRRSG